MKKAIIFAVAGVVLLAAGGGAVWWFGMRDAGGAEAQAAVPKEAVPQKYVSLDKVVVMLRRAPEENVTRYMSMDLVFTTAIEKEKDTKEHLPLLRSIAVRALASMTAQQVSAMTIDELAAEVNRAFAEDYDKAHRSKPFVEAMVGKLIVE
jgi:flagellar protein FliL